MISGTGSCAISYSSGLHCFGATRARIASGTCSMPGVCSSCVCSCRASRRMRRTGHLIIYLVGLRVYRCHKNPAGLAVDFGAGAEHFRWGLPKISTDVAPDVWIGHPNRRIPLSPLVAYCDLQDTIQGCKPRCLAKEKRIRLGFTLSLQALALRIKLRTSCRC